MKIQLSAVLMVLVMIGVAAVTAAAQNTQPNLPAGTGDLWTACTAMEKVFAVGLSSITAIIGMVLGWCIFPMTIAPLAYLTQSELAIWSSRLSVAIGGGIAGFVFPFMGLLRLFGS